MGRKKRQRQLSQHSSACQSDPVTNNKPYVSCIKRTKGDDDNGTPTGLSPDIDSSINDITYDNSYNDIINGKCNSPTNWLKEIYSISKQNSSTAKSRNSHDSTSCHQVTSTTSKSLSKQDDIEFLIKQLNSIKQLLWPTAIQTSQCKNNRMKKTNRKTSPSHEFYLARERCNPFEQLNKQKWIDYNTRPFVCRSALKLANIDSMLGFELTKSISDTFKFVDLCGAPGGFSEYILLRRLSDGGCKSSCLGYGMSLVGMNESGSGIMWDIQTLTTLVSKRIESDERVNRWKVCNGKDGTGDIYNWDNVLALQNEIWNGALSYDDHNIQRDDYDDKWKVDLVVADGGFDAQRDSECQESLAHRIVTCQTASCLILLKKGGNFVIKMFGFQHCKKLMMHLYNSFETLVFMKPITSRPASAERYVVCLNYNGLDTSFDALSWRDEIIDCLENKKDGETSSFDDYLDEIDMKMLQLNIHACSAIISRLEQSLLSNKQSQEQESGKLEIDYMFYQKNFNITF